MKLGTKLALLTFAFGTLSLLTMAGFYYIESRQSALERTLGILQVAAQQRAEQVQAGLVDQARVTATLGHTPLLVEMLQQSNRRFDDMTVQARTAALEDLNSRWKAVGRDDDPFIRAYTDNRAARLLKGHEQRNPGLYGEVFVTDRHGALVAATGRLTTFIHAHKYWWLAGYADGGGRVFFDDRGFDASVGGYVVGVVVPIIADGGVIGLIKANLSLAGPLEALVADYNAKHLGIMRITRSGGAVVVEAGKQPLSTRIPDDVAPTLVGRAAGTHQSREANSLVAFAPVPVTLGSASYGLGGSFESVDHILGNTGEAWMVTIDLPVDEALAHQRDSIAAIVRIGMGLIIMLGLLALVASRSIVRPVVMLAENARRIGSGDFDVSIEATGADELGELGRAFNTMAANLKATTISRDSLAEEVAMRARLEVKLRDSESFLRQILESIPGMVFTTRSDGLCDYQSQQWVDYTGVPVSEQLGDGWNKLLHPDDQPVALCAWKAAVDEQAPYDLEYRVRRADGVYEWFRVIGRPVRDPSGRIVRWFGVAMNIERLKRAEEALLKKSEALQRTNAELEEFAYVVSHDLKAPLRAVSNLASVIEEDAAEQLDEESRSHLRLLRERVRTMNELIDGLLSYARSGQTGQHPVPVALRPLLTDLVRQLELPPDVTVELEDPLPTLSADAVQLRQIFQNLIGNAVAHRDRPEGKVWVRAREDSDCWCLEVADDGPGIPEDARQSIFRIFSGSGKAGHTGIGLAVVRKLVLANGGRIEITDNPPRGALFQIYWPKR